MSPDLLRWIAAIALFGHGVGHVLFMPVLFPAMRLEASGRSWLLSGALGDGPTGAVTSVVGGVLVIAFIAVAGGIAMQTTWWRAVAIGAALASIILVAVLWGGLLSGPATAAAVFDVAILVALTMVGWPARTLIGS